MTQLLNILKFICLFLWQLPQSIIGWLLILYFYIVGKVKFIKYYKNAFIFVSNKMNGSISLGTIIILCDAHSRSNGTIQHEIGHVIQSQYLGWLYLFIIGIPSICWAGTYTKFGFKNYYSFYTEKLANKLGYVEEYKYGASYRLKIIKDILWA